MYIPCRSCVWLDLAGRSTEFARQTFTVEIIEGSAHVCTRGLIADHSARNPASARQAPDSNAECGCLCVCVGWTGRSICLIGSRGVESMPS